MKQDILKIAGVKDEKSFYKKFPSEEAFMKIHGKEFKKAKMGTAMVKKQLTQLTDFANPPQAQVGTYIGGNTSMYNPVNYTDMYDEADYATTGMNREMRMQDDNLAAQQAQATNADKGGFGNIMQSIGGVAKIAEAMRQGGYVPRGKNGLISMPDFTKADKTINRQFKYDNSKFGQGMNKLGKDIGAGYDKLDSSLSNVGGVSGALGIGQDLLGGFQELKQEKDAQKQANQFNRLSGLTNQVAGLTPDIAARKYVRPEDMQMDPNQFAQSNGSAIGNPFLQMQEGGSIGGNPTELQNMYTNGDTLYSDLGYEPLSDSDIVKQYRRGGLIPRAQFGIDKMAGQAGGALGSLIGGGKGRPTAGGKIGSTVGSTIGKFVPIPGASAILGGVGGLVGGIFGGKSAAKTEDWQNQGLQNMQNAAFMQGTRAMQAQNSAYMEDGGEVGLKYLSHDWQPQVITKFGDYDVKDLLRDDPTMDTLRSGGHLKDYSYTAPSARAMQTYAMGGELQTHWGGEAEPISYNPYLPDGGETVMFRGQSHEESDGQGRTGIGVTYGENPVEVERGEPAVKLKDGGNEESLVVYGNMKIPSYGLSELNDPLAKGKKFKNYANLLSKKESKQNKIVEKGTDIINETDPDDAFDLLKLNSAQAMVKGGNMKLKNYADKKILLSGVQNAILDTAEEMGVESDALSKGMIKQDKNSNMAKFGAKLETAQSGINQPLSKILPMSTYYRIDPKTDFKMQTTPEVKKKVEQSQPKPAEKKTINKSKGKSKPVINESILPMPKVDLSMDRRNFDIENPEIRTEAIRALDPFHAAEPGLPAFKVSDSPTKEKKDKFGIDDLLRQLQPYLIPSNQEALDPNQLSGEMLALATNQLQPVQAQQYTPQLETPYSVSFQDQMNANQADFNALQRQLGYNPAAASQLAAQKYAANSAILGQQFRANQEMQMGAYNRNRGVLNDATLKNLAILDTQYQRQEQAKSNTKMQAQVALNSIADKIAKNKLENRTLGIQENMYNYRFGPKGRAYNVNAPYEFNTQLASMSADDIQEIADKKRESEKKSGSKTARNGSIVKAIKNL